MKHTLSRPRSTCATGLGLIMLLALSACAPAPQGPTRVEAENEIAIRTLLGMMESGNADGAAGLFHPDAVYDDFANQTEYRGLEEISGYLTQGSRWADGVSLTLTSVHISDWGAVAEWVFSGIQVRPMGSLVPVATGRDVVLNGITVVEMESGRIRRAADYTDALPLVLQLGAEVHMPGGAVLKRDVSGDLPESLPDTLQSQEPS